MADRTTTFYDVYRAIVNAVLPTTPTTGSLGALVKSNLTGDAYVRLGAPAGASVSADIAALPTAVGVWAAATRTLTSALTSINSIQVGTITNAIASVATTATITAVVAAKSVVLNLGTSSTIAAVASDVGVRLDLTNTTTVTATRGASATEAITSFAVVEFK